MVNVSHVTCVRYVGSCSSKVNRFKLVEPVWVNTVDVSQYSAHALLYTPSVKAADCFLEMSGNDLNMKANLVIE